LVKVITAFLIFAIAVQLSRHTVQEAYRKQSAGEQLTPDTKILLSAINALGGKAQGESKHTHVSFFDPLNRDVAGAPKWPFHAGDRPVVPISMWNSGDFYLNERANAGTVIIANRDYALSKKMFDDFLQNAKYLSAGSGVPPHDQASGTYGTYQGPIITQREAEALLKMEKAVCAMSRIEWQDETGCYATDFCECEWFEPPPSNYNRHTCKSHSGTEAKIECSPR
jgi:hypothetical protein